MSSIDGDREPVVTTDTGPWAMVPAWVLTVGLVGSELAVYVALRTFADRSGDASPYVRTIADRAGVGLRTAEKAIARLRDLGLVTSTQRHRADGSLAGCDYHLTDVMPPSLRTSGGPLDPEGGPVSADGGPRTDGGTPRPGGRDPSGPTDGTPPVPQDGARTHHLEHTNEHQAPTEPAPPNGGTPTATTKTGTRVPDPFPLTDDLLTWVRTDCPDVPRSEHDRFMDFWRGQPGAKGRKVDWPATWRNWMRRTQDDIRDGRRRPAGRRSTTDERVEQARSLREWASALDDADPGTAAPRRLATVTALAVEGTPA